MIWLVAQVQMALEFCFVCGGKPWLEALITCMYLYVLLLQGLVSRAWVKRRRRLGARRYWGCLGWTWSASSRLTTSPSHPHPMARRLCPCHRARVQPHTTTCTPELLMTMVQTRGYVYSPEPLSLIILIIVVKYYYYYYATVHVCELLVLYNNIIVVPFSFLWKKKKPFCFL